MGLGIDIQLRFWHSHFQKSKFLSFMEFDTAVRRDIPIICVVDNSAWGMIKHCQEISLGSDRCTCSDQYWAHHNARAPNRAEAARRRDENPI
jgi:hypothetical protein